MHSLMLRMLILAAIVLAVAAGSVFSQTPARAAIPAPTPNPELTPAIKLLREGETRKARDALKKILKKNDADGEAWYYLGVVHLQLNDFKKGSEAFKKTIERRPDLAAQAHAGYAYALVLRNELQLAVISANRALGVDPKNVEALYTLGIVDLRRGSRLDAIKKAETLIALKPDFGAAYLLKSQAIISTGTAMYTMSVSKEERQQRYRSALEALEKYLQLETDPQAAARWQEQREILKFYSGESGRVYGVREVTTKARLLSKPEPSYTQQARDAQTRGTVVLRCVFAGDGTVTHILIIQALPNGLTERAIAAAKQIRFVPATLNGQPVSTFMQLEYNFNIY